MVDKLLKEYELEFEGITLPVKIVYKEGEYVRGYMLDIPEYGPGTKALLDNLKHEIIMDGSIKAERFLDPKFIEYLKEQFRQKAELILKRELVQLDAYTKDSLIAILLNEMLGLGKIEFLLSDGNLEEIVVNAASEPVWVYHKEFAWLKTNVWIETEEQIQNYASIIARRGGKQITILTPLLDTHLVTGDRANATLFPISGKGNTITIRRFRRDPWTVTDLIKNRTTTSDVMALIWLCIQYEMNMILSGGTASGKCVSGDSRILTAGGYKQIKEIVEGEMGKSSPAKTDDGFYSSSADIEVFSFNPNNANVEKAQVSRVWKRRAPATLLRVTTQTGKKLEVTPEHPFFVVNGFIEKKRADELKIGDFVPTARKLDAEFYVPAILNAPSSEGFLKKNENGLQMKAWYNSNKWVKIPKTISCELSRFIGYVLGDGHITLNRQAVRFFNKNQSLLQDFRDCGEKLFGISGKLCYPKNRCEYIEFNSKIISEFLVQNFNIKPGKKSDVISIPKEILFGEKAILKEMISALFECEASVDVKKAELEFSSSSPLVVDDLSVALHRFGIIHTIKNGAKRNRLFISGKPLQDFGNTIGFFFAQKNDLILRAKKQRFSPNIDFIPNVGPVISQLRKNLFAYEREIKGSLSREAISSYTNGERNPTRESLLVVAEELEKRYSTLCAQKHEMDRIMERHESCKKMLALAKNIYKHINFTRKGLAQKTGLSKDTLYLWEMGKVSPTPDFVCDLSETISEQFDDYYEQVQAPLGSLAQAKAIGLKPTDIMNMVGLSEKTVYNHFSKDCPKGKTREIFSKVEEWQKNKIGQLNEIKGLAKELKNMVEEYRNYDYASAIKGLKQLLKVGASVSEARGQQLVEERLKKAVSEENLSNIKWLRQIAESNVLWDRIKKIERVNPKEDWVYDLTVEGNHTFFANNIVAHNTSFMNICLPFMQPNHRIITIEDTRELVLPEFLHWVPMTTREPNAEGKGGVTMLDLLVNSLRQRPDRIIVGETRRQTEAEVMFEAMHTGHSVYTTFHANTAEETIRRFTNPPIDIPPTVLDSVHLNVVMFRNRRLGVRRVLQVAEFIPEKRGNEETLKANTLYRWRAGSDTIEKDAESIRLYDELSMHTGMTYDEIGKDLAVKKRILDWLVKYDLHNVTDVGKVMAKFYIDQNEIIKMVEKDQRPQL